jgi:Tfp pilus assembly protein PilF
VNDTPSIYPLRPESQVSSAPTPLFASDADSFVQQLRLAAQAHRAGRLDEAIASYLRLLAVRPYHAELHNNLGVALRLVGKLEASVSHHRLSLAADPQNPALHSNLGNALRAANRLDEAVKHHFHSITLNRDYAEGFFNLALCLRDLGRIDEAVGCFGRALALNPDNRRARVELAIALLVRGELAQGFAAYEARKRLPETPAPDFTQPAWDGGPIAGKRILLYPEQGLSDVLLFVRFARELKRRGATVLVLCQALLKELLATVDFIDGVVAEGEKLPPFDLHASMVSLPHLCRADFDALSAEPPYLHAPPVSRIKLGRVEKAKLRIGIYWAAMPGQPQDRQRSAPFAQFLALAGDPELLVFSLQGGVHRRISSVRRRRCTMSAAASSISARPPPLCRNSISCCRSMRRSPISRRRWGSRPGSCCPRPSTGAGSSAAPRRPGIPRRACSASPGRSTGTRCSPACGTSLMR